MTNDQATPQTARTDRDTFGAKDAILFWYFSLALILAILMGTLFPAVDAYGEMASFGWPAFWITMVIWLLGGIPVLVLFNTLSKVLVDLAAIRASLESDREGAH